MKIDVEVRPGSSRVQVERTGDLSFKVYLHSPPERDKANMELIETLSEYFGVSKGEIEIVSGLRSKKKKINIISI